MAISGYNRPPLAEAAGSRSGGTVNGSHCSKPGITAPPDLVELGNLQHAFQIVNVLDKPFLIGSDYAITRSSGGRLLGGTVFTQYTGTSVSMHIASFVPNWISRALIWWVFHYPFEVLKVEKLVCATARPRALQLCLRFGFAEEVTLHNVVPEGPLVILSMVPAACRWLGERPRNTKVIVHPGNPDVFRN